MEIDTLDDFTVNQACFDFTTAYWNGHEVRWMPNILSSLFENIFPFLETRCATLLGRVSHSPQPAPTKPKKDIWTGSRDLVDFYLNQKIHPEETVVSQANVITSPISLSQLLSLEYLNQGIQPIPFTLPAELAILPPFFVLPEGLSLEVFNLPPPLPAPFLPTFDPHFANNFQGQYLAAENEKILASAAELAKAELLIAVHGYEIKQALSQIDTAEQARAAALITAQVKAETAKREHAKALDAIFFARIETDPPQVPPRGWASEPYEVTYNRWLAQRTKTHEAAIAQIKTANQAIDEAKVAGENLTTLTQALIAARSKASAIPFPLQQEAPQLTNFSPKFDLELLWGKEYVSNLYQEFGLPDPFAQTSLATDQSYVSKLFESVGIKDIKELQSTNIPFEDPFYPKFTQKIEEPQACLTKQELVTTLAIEEYFNNGKARPSMATVDNYASTLALNKPSGPFNRVPLLGYPDQSTIHFHCGICNSLTSIVEGGLCLNTSLDRGFAVQPHLIHSNNVAKGLLFVLFENTKANLQKLQTAGVHVNSSFTAQLPEFTLEHSKIAESIEYEIEHLTTIAKNILAKENPNLKQVHVTFSNGGYVFKEALKALSPEYRDTIIVITAGTTSIIENHLAHKVYNVIGSKDTASQICNGGMDGIEAAKKNGADVRVIPQNETQTAVKGHYFMQPEYQKEIAKFIKTEVENEYEIY